MNTVLFYSSLQIKTKTFFKFCYALTKVTFLPVLYMLTVPCLLSCQSSGWSSGISGLKSFLFSFWYFQLPINLASSLRRNHFFTWRNLFCSDIYLVYEEVFYLYGLPYMLYSVPLLKNIRSKLFFSKVSPFLADLVLQYHKIEICIIATGQITVFGAHFVQ